MRVSLLNLWAAIILIGDSRQVVKIPRSNGRDKSIHREVAVDLPQSGAAPIGVLLGWTVVTLQVNIHSLNNISLFKYSRRYFSAVLWFHNSASCLVIPFMTILLVCPVTVFVRFPRNVPPMSTSPPPESGSGLALSLLSQDLRPCRFELGQLSMSVSLRFFLARDSQWTCKVGPNVCHLLWAPWNWAAHGGRFCRPQNPSTLREVSSPVHQPVLKRLFNPQCILYSSGAESAVWTRCTWQAPVLYMRDDGEFWPDIKATTDLDEAVLFFSMDLS